MKQCYKWLFCLLFCAIVAHTEDMINIDVGAKLTLKARYYVSQSTIYSTDLFPQIHKRFKIATIPLDKLNLHLKSVEVKQIFARFGYEISTFESDIVEFHFTSDMRQHKEREFIKKMYIQHYGENLRIDSITIRPIGSLPDIYEISSFKIAPNAVKKSSGSFEMTYKANQKHKKISFLYALEGEIAILRSNENLHTNDVLNAQNTRKDIIAFEKMNAEHVMQSDLHKYSAKAFIGADSIITKDKIKPKIIVKKGQIILAKSHIEGVMLEVRLIAKQNATHNDIINAENPQSGKILRVKITDEGKGDII